jgi:hypothetical protein
MDECTGPVFLVTYFVSLDDARARKKKVNMTDSITTHSQGTSYQLGRVKYRPLELWREEIAVKHQVRAEIDCKA